MTDVKISENPSKTLDVERSMFGRVYTEGFLLFYELRTNEGKNPKNNASMGPKNEESASRPLLSYAMFKIHIGVWGKSNAGSHDVF